MSWQCTEGPYGRYPGEDGYEEDLTRYTVEQIENKLRRRDDDDSIEEQVISHINEAGKNNKVSWIVGVSSYDVECIGTYLTERVFRSAHVIEIDESAKLIKMEKYFDDDDDVYNIGNQRMQFEISEKGNGFHVPILNVTMDTNKAETLIDKIQNICGYLIVFSMDGPTKAQEPHCSVLKL
jgi:hypothetical protein